MTDPSQLLKIDTALCAHCGLCAKDCAFHALSLVNGEPTLVHPERCMHCQHCFAICPTGAITFNGIHFDAATPVHDLALPTGDEAINYLKSRRSIRQFRADDVDRAVLEKLLSALGNTPTGCNARALTFTCISTRAAMDEFRAAFLRTIEAHRDGTKLLPRWLALPAIQMRNGKGDLFFRDAPGMLIVSSDETAPGVTTPKEDVAVAIANFELLANSHGLGTCWCGFLKLVQEVVPELLTETLGLRPSTPFYAMLFGYPAVHYARTVVRDTEAKIIWK